MPGEDEQPEADEVTDNGDGPTMPTFDPDAPLKAADVFHLALEVHEMRGRLDGIEKRLDDIIRILSPQAALALRERCLEVTGQLGAGVLDFAKVLIKSWVGFILSLAILTIAIPTGLVIRGSLTEGFTIEPASENAAAHGDHAPAATPVPAPGELQPEP